MDVAVERCAGLDVHRDNLVATVRVPGSGPAPWSPADAEAYYHDDLVVCLMRGGFTRVEQTLLEGGRTSAVIQQRMEFQEVMRDRFTEVIEDATDGKASAS